MKIEFTENPQTKDVDFLSQKINEEFSEFGKAYAFGFFIRNDNGEIIAGCNGSVIYDFIYTDQLWIHKNYRKQGLGQKLMKAVHDYGREQGCKMATVQTISFQNAKAFYEKLGYVCDFERDMGNHRVFFLKKELEHK